MENILIRHATKNDTATILGLLYELGRSKAKKDSDINIFEKLVEKYLADSDKEILVAEHQSNVLGMVSMMFLPRLNQEFFELYIPELVVAKEYQNQNIGRMLLDACIEEAKEKKCHRIRLESGNKRKDSHIFYINLGFDQSALSFSKGLN